ncbi:hypothetical protein SEA_PLATTE_23 [Microbacterium phage Platte]|nr:hypothetical protein SEA_PIONEER3_22 [Microbacterium phage Pioneer3]QZD97616.1 hypothetical protein SEA_PLATTE_23 [Microbacterium phage Platte]
MNTIPLLEDGTMPVDMQVPAPDMIQVSLTLRDELDFPIERRGYRTRMPHAPEEKLAVAKAIGNAAEKTAKHMMGLPIEEER